MLNFNDFFKDAEGTRNYFGVSDFASPDCIKWHKLNQKPRQEFDKSTLLTFAIGTALENLLAEKINLQNRQEKIIIDPILPFIGHIDGMKDNVLYEIKSINSLSFSKLENAKPEHITQARLYAAGLEIDKFTIIYICKDPKKGQNPIKQFDFILREHPQTIIETAMDKIIEIAQLPDAPLPNPADYNGEFGPKGWRCRPDRGTSQGYCVYRNICPLGLKFSRN